LSLVAVVGAGDIRAAVVRVDYLYKQEGALRQQRRTQSRWALVAREQQHQQIKVPAVLILFLIPQPHWVVVVVAAIVGQQVNLRHRVMAKTAGLEAAAAIRQVAQQRALAAQLRKAIAVAQQVTASLVEMATLTVLQTPLVAVAAGLAV